ncbi:MAG: PAAR domain-containing protein [Planctomycetota bacterium]
MGQPAARVGDMRMQQSPHCHAPIHPPAPVPTPVPHPGLPGALVSGCFTVLIANMPAANVTGQSIPCTVAGCVPAGPAMVSKGSTSVMIGGMPAARVGDMTAHSSCAAPVPGPTGTIMPPGAPTVLIG